MLRAGSAPRRSPRLRTGDDALPSAPRRGPRVSALRDDFVPVDLTGFWASAAVGLELLGRQTARPITICRRARATTLPLASCRSAVPRLWSIFLQRVRAATSSAAPVKPLLPCRSAVPRRRSIS